METGTWEMPKLVIAEREREGFRVGDWDSEVGRSGWQWHLFGHKTMFFLFFKKMFVLINEIFITSLDFN